jgi:uncharacterized membrane protein YdfJ with MMPL/SSD domain
MADEAVRVNKSAFVRGVLKDIGALTANPPEGWRQKVEEALQKQGLSMHNVTIYQIRQNALKAKGEKKARKKAEAAAVTATAPTTNGSKLTVDNLRAVQQFAKTVGGIDSLQEAINVLKDFKG